MTICLGCSFASLSLTFVALHDKHKLSLANYGHTIDPDKDIQYEAFASSAAMTPAGAWAEDDPVVRNLRVTSRARFACRTARIIDVVSRASLFTPTLAGND